MHSIPPLIPNVLPQLKPSQPHHSMKVPSITLVSEPGLFFFIVLSYVPILGPSIMAATNPAVPPTRCTAEHPVRMMIKSIMHKFQRLTLPRLQKFLVVCDLYLSLLFSFPPSLDKRNKKKKKKERKKQKHQRKTSPRRLKKP